jgi:hypothetical protein
MTVSEMRIMGGSGDTKVMWDSEQEAEVENARRTFNDLRGRGYAAFAVRTSGEKGRQVTEFDPEAEKLIMVPQIAGG